MKLNDFIEDIHANAVAHGWWEEERPYGEILALIHSEWSEALEEYRAGRPMVWHACTATGENTICESVALCYRKTNVAECGYRNRKLEGIAVELADGVIRIFDYFGYDGIKYEDGIDIDKAIDILPNSVKADLATMPFPEFINQLHKMTVFAYTCSARHLFDVVAVVFLWIKAHGFDPMEIMQQKHAYNKTRPYKHGKIC